MKKLSFSSRSALSPSIRSSEVHLPRVEFCMDLGGQQTLFFLPIVKGSQM